MRNLESGFLFVILTLPSILAIEKRGIAATSAPSCYVKHVSRGACRDKYAAIAGHMNCIDDPNVDIRHEIPDPAGEVEIVAVHNEIRSIVDPKAADMLDIHYSNGLEGSALRWARKCSDVSNTWYERTAPGAYNPGMNTYISDHEMTWTEVIREWQKENSSFVYGQTNDTRNTANYVQMIWADTATVGCAYSECMGEGNWYLYVCHYAPVFNETLFSTPYEQGAAPCEKCPGHCNSNETNTLCDCAGVLCLGGSKLNLTTCQCECIKEVSHYNGSLCELVCDPNGDDPACGQPPYTADSCATCQDTMFHCPWMCNICPYADKSYKEGSELLPLEKVLPECTTTTTPISTTTRMTPGVSLQPGTGTPRGGNGSGGSSTTSSGTGISSSLGTGNSLGSGTNASSGSSTNAGGSGSSGSGVGATGTTPPGGGTGSVGNGSGTGGNSAKQGGQNSAAGSHSLMSLISGMLFVAVRRVC